MNDQGGQAGFGYRNNVLMWDDTDLGELARSNGTPLYVVNNRCLRQAVQDVRGAFTARKISAQLFFSVKTNPLPRVLSVLADAGVGAEVISEFELWLARRAGIEAQKIVVNGTVMSQALLESAVSAGVALINIESSSQLSALRETVRRFRKQANVGLRVNPRIRSGPFDFTLSTGNSASPIGFVAGSKEWEDVLQTIKDEPLLQLKGIHFHLGSGIRRANPYRTALKAVSGVWLDLIHRGFTPEVLDIGGGFSTSTLKELNLWEAIRLFVWSLPQKPPAPADKLVDEIASECEKAFHALAQGANGQSPELYIEPGRAISGPAQILLLQVKDIVDHHGRRLTAVCDGGAMNLSLMLLTEYHEILPVYGNINGSRRRYDLVGSLPTPLDIVGRGKELPTLRIGDVLAILNTGAYFTSLGNTFAGERPGVVFIDGLKSRVVRRREMFTDLVSRDDID